MVLAILVLRYGVCGTVKDASIRVLRCEGLWYYGLKGNQLWYTISSP